MKTLGLLGGMSWESTAVYYRLLNEGVKTGLGGLHSAPLLLLSYDFAGIAESQAAGDWDRLGATLADGARRLEQAGAEALLICTNTMHKLFAQVQAAVSVPVLHIADATAPAIRAAGSRHPLLLATRFTMEQGFYRDRLAEAHGIETLVPGQADRDMVHDVIYRELCRGLVEPASKQRYLDLIAASRAGDSTGGATGGADGVILGCTEIGLLLSQADLDLPVFDTTALHVAAGLRFMLEA